MPNQDKTEQEVATALAKMQKDLKQEAQKHKAAATQAKKLAEDLKKLLKP